MIMTHATGRTQRAPRGRIRENAAPSAADLDRRLSVMRAALEASRRENDRLRRSWALLRAENTRLVTQLNERSTTADRRSAMRESLRDRCSLDP
jgi:hypothetical protein